MRRRLTYANVVATLARVRHEWRGACRDVRAVRGGETLASSPIVHVSCGEADEGSGAANCIATH